MSELSQDEFTVLLIAAEGESMCPIGRWRAPILSLTNRGLMTRNDGFNYGITAEGRKACEQRNEDDDKALRALLARDPKTIEALPIEEDSEGPLLAEELKNGGT